MHTATHAVCVLQRSTKSPVVPRLICVHQKTKQMLFALYVVMLLLGHYYFVFLGSIAHAVLESGQAIRS